MPAIRNTKTKTKTPSPADIKSSKSSSISPNPKPAAPGWSREQKMMLFNHVLKFGEKDWGVAAPGKTGHQCQMQWKKTLLPFIRRTCGL